MRLFAIIGALALAALACNTLLPPRPPLEWNPDPTNLVVQASSSGGMLPDPNNVPGARLWGDGRLVWAEFDSSGGRLVQTRTLTPDEMRALLQRIENDGFFGWKDQYSPGQVFDAPSTCVTVWLTSQSKSTCEILSGAPAGFERLYADLASGAGQAGNDLAPERGYFSVMSLGPAAGAGSGPVTDWPGEALGLPLDQALGGVWIEGAALQAAWQAVNANSLYPLLREGDTLYTARLLAPGVTLADPPEP